MRIFGQVFRLLEHFLHAVHLLESVRDSEGYCVYTTVQLFKVLRLPNSNVHIGGIVVHRPELDSLLLQAHCLDHRVETQGDVGAGVPEIETDEVF